MILLRVLVSLGFYVHLQRRELDSSSRRRGLIALL
jgi:hypothetical protein